MCQIVQDVGNTQGFFWLTEILWDHKFLSDVTGCRKTQMLHCTSSNIPIKTITSVLKVSTYIITYQTCCKIVILYFSTFKTDIILYIFDNKNLVIFTFSTTCSKDSGLVEKILTQIFSRSV